MCQNLVSTVSLNNGKENIKVIVFVLIIVFFSPFCFSLNPKVHVESKNVYIANAEKCKLLEQIDSIAKTAKDSLPDCYLDDLKRIQLFEISEPRDTTYYTYKGKLMFTTESYEPDPKDIKCIFEGKNPSHDLEIIFSGVFLILDNSKALVSNGKLFFIEENLYNILKTEYSFRKQRVKQKYWSRISIYNNAVFSMVITKDGTLRDIKYCRGQRWIKQIYK